MKNAVHKFGGAALKNPERIKTVAQIIEHEKPQLVVFSAIDKTTNAFEKIVELHLKGEESSGQLQAIRQFHEELVLDLFGSLKNEAGENIEKIFTYCSTYLKHSKTAHYDEIYDQIIPAGELLSSKILHAYLSISNSGIEWLDARKILITDSRFRKATPELKESSSNLNNFLKPNCINIIQGFIGGTDKNLMTTIGREGSDYSAALFANFIDAKKLVVWKDVDGVLNADPRYFNSPSLIEKLNYKEAIELSYYGATIIHPKTIQPLVEKNIPLHVRSFLNIENQGSVISSKSTNNTNTAIYIYKPSQLLITLESKSLDFIEESQMVEIYHTLFKHKFEVNMVQNSAVNCSICVDTDTHKTEDLIEAFSNDFNVKYNTNLELLTVRNYKDHQLQELLLNKQLVIEQKTRNTLKLLFK